MITELAAVIDLVDFINWRAGNCFRFGRARGVKFLSFGTFLRFPCPLAFFIFSSRSGRSRNKKKITKLIIYKVNLMTNPNHVNLKLFDLVRNYSIFFYLLTSIP